MTRVAPDRVIPETEPRLYRGESVQADQSGSTAILAGEIIRDPVAAVEMPLLDPGSTR